jgi:hypothetical protein
LRLAIRGTTVSPACFAIARPNRRRSWGEAMLRFSDVIDHRGDEEYEPVGDEDGEEDNG